MKMNLSLRRAPTIALAGLGAVALVAGAFAAESARAGRHAARPVGVVAVAGPQPWVASSYPDPPSPGRFPPQSRDAPSASPLPPGSPLVRLRDVAFGTPLDGWGVGYMSDGSLAFTQTYDGGRTWSAPRPLPGNPGGWWPTAVRFADARHGWVYGTGAVATDDGGLTWHDAGLRGQVYEVAPVGGEVWAAVGCGRGESCEATLYRAPLGGRTWTRMRWAPFDGAHQPEMGLVRVSERVAFASLFGSEQATGRIYRTDDGGATWRPLPEPCQTASISTLSLASLDGRTVWLACGDVWGAGSASKAVYVSIDGGAAWALRASATFQDAADVGDIRLGGYPGPLRLATPISGFLGLSGPGAGSGIASRDGGRTWRQVPGFEGDDVSFWFVDPRHGWALSSGSLEGTSDGGRTWAHLWGLP